MFFPRLHIIKKKVLKGLKVIVGPAFVIFVSNIDSMEVKPIMTRKLRRRPNDPVPIPDKRRKPAPDILHVDLHCLCLRGGGHSLSTRCSLTLFQCQFQFLDENFNVRDHVNLVSLTLQTSVKLFTNRRTDNGRPQNVKQGKCL